MRIHVTYDNFKWFNSYKIHVTFKTVLPWSNVQVENDAKSLKYTGESQRTHRNTNNCAVRAKVLRAVSLKTQVFCGVTICRWMSSPQMFWTDTAPSFSASISPVQEGLNWLTLKTMFLQNVRNYSFNDLASHPKRPKCSITMLLVCICNAVVQDIQ
jgi:hypothetical protein